MSLSRRFSSSGAGSFRGAIGTSRPTWSTMGSKSVMKDIMHAGVAGGRFRCGAPGKELPDVVNDIVPLKRWSGIDLVALDMVMSEQACITRQFIIRELFCNQPAR